MRNDRDRGIRVKVTRRVAGEAANLFYRRVVYLRRKTQTTKINCIDMQIIAYYYGR